MNKTLVVTSLVLLTIGFCQATTDELSPEKAVFLGERDPRDVEGKGHKIFRVKDTNPPKNRPALFTNPVTALQRLIKPGDISSNRPQIQDGNRLPSFLSVSAIKPPKFTGIKQFWRPGQKPAVEAKPADTIPKPDSAGIPESVYPVSNQPYLETYYHEDPYYVKNYGAVYSDSPYYNQYHEAPQIIAIPIAELESSSKSGWLKELIANSTVLGTIKL